MTTMNLFARLLSTIALLSLAACGGGGGDSGTSPLVPAPGTGASSVASLVLELSAPSIANSSTTGVTATVTALDSNRNVVKNAAVILSANSDAVITLLGTQGSATDSTGRLQGIVTLGSNRTNRKITVQASIGALAPVTAELQVVDGTTSVNPAAIDIIASSTTAGSGGDGVTIRAFVKDKNNNAMAGVAVAFAASSGTLSGSSLATDLAGVASATFSAGADRSNRVATISVTAATISKSLDIPITGTRLLLSGPSSLILGGVATFDIVVTDSKSNVVPGVTIAAVSSLGNALVPSGGVGGAVSNANGQVRFAYTATNSGTDTVNFSGYGASVSPAPALVVSAEDFAFVSPAAGATVNVNTPVSLQVRLRSGGVAQGGQTINFASTGGTLTPSVAVTDPTTGIAAVTLTTASAGPVTVQASVQGKTTTATLPLTIIATQPTTLVLQVNPTAVAPNSGVTATNQAQVTAKVTDAVGNPVQGQVVNFSRVTDPSGGNLLQATATTDANGQATVAYRPGAQSTANNGVILSASVASSSPLVSASATLTVNQSALFIALGTGNTISNLNPQTYKKDWVVYVTDSNGIPLNGATVTIKAIPTHYITGNLVWGGKVWTYASGIQFCPNEDANFDGILAGGEDANGDGILWPGNVISVTPGSVQTVNGLATISLIYAESYVPWVRMKLTASASVAGTESKTDVEFIVTGLSDDFSLETNAPAGVVSPFGLAPKGGAVCSVTAPN
jgi:hypothetical protein